MEEALAIRPLFTDMNKKISQIYEDRRELSLFKDELLIPNRSK